MVNPDPLEVASWRLVAGTLATELLPDLATDALVRGVDSPSLRELAGHSRGDVRGARDLFLKVLDELGIALLPVDDALWALIRNIARAMVDGETDPIDGALEIDRTRSRVVDGGDLRGFGGIYWWHTERPEEREQIAASARHEAAHLLSRAHPRRWIQLRAQAGKSPLARSIGPGPRTPITAADISISSQLTSDVEAWAAEHRTVMEGWPGRGGFRSQEHAENFVRGGEVLVDRLQRELGDGYRVEYMPEPTRPPGLRLAKTRRAP